MPDPAEYGNGDGYEYFDEEYEFVDDRTSFEEMVDSCLGMFVIYLLLSALIVLIGVLFYQLFQYNG